ncbi:hypothetical protein ACFQJC_14485 [Haloferax namakaokahaiae]|uniref:Uncharacterized protein n=1 Tax=Haloferax namakaokahaiae TaxID=1748331 RepID=A0ABD5ZHZ3_9EURY
MSQPLVSDVATERSGATPTATGTTGETFEITTETDQMGPVDAWFDERSISQEEAQLLLDAASTVATLVFLYLALVKE